MKPPPTSSDYSEDALLQASIQGDREAFGQLMKKHHAAILGLVQKHVRQTEESEDVVQQVFLQAYRHIGNFRGESKLFTWLYTIALNQVRNHVRQRKIRQTVSIDAPSGSDDSRLPQWPDTSPTPDEIAEHRGDLVRVHEALVTLSEEHRSIFTLHYFQHLSLKDVAQKIERPLGTVKVYLHRARKMVISHLQSKGGAPHV